MIRISLLNHHTNANCIDFSEVFVQRMYKVFEQLQRDMI